jgi:hypothetical protein
MAFCDQKVALQSALLREFGRSGRKQCTRARAAVLSKNTRELFLQTR